MKKIISIVILLLSQVTIAQKQPNVVFILADDLGINALNCYGNKAVESPNIDKLYNEGMSFSNAYSSDPTCAPSRASIMSGQYAPRTNIYRVVDRWRMNNKGAAIARKHMKYIPPASNHLYSGNSGLSPDNFNLAKAFKSNGYKTAAYGKWHLGTGTSAMHNMGFDKAIETKLHYNFKSTPQQNDYDSKIYNSDYCTEKGIQFMEESIKEEKPFFLYMPYFLVHHPADPKKKHLDHFKELYKGTEYDHLDVLTVLAMIKSLDDSVGDLMAALKRLGIEENTIVVFASDNGHYKVKGNNIFALPYRGNKGDIQDGGIRVPFMVKWKNKIKQNTKSETPTIHVDIYPTLAEMANLDITEKHILDGKSLSSTLLNTSQEKSTKPLIWFYTNTAKWLPKENRLFNSWFNAIQEYPYKFLESVEYGTFELYNLEKDPQELNNLYKQKPKVAKRMLEKLEVWKKNTNLPKPELNPEYED